MNRIMLFLILFVSCETSKENDNYIIIQKEDFTIIPLKCEKHYFEEIINPANIGIIDSKILISERHRVPEEHPRIHIINSQNWTYDKPKGKYGEGPLEAIDASLFYKGENGNTFWAYSMNGRKLVEYSMSDTTLLGKNEWKMPEPMRDLWFFTQASDSSFLGISRVDKHRILEFDKEGNKIGGYGNWEKVKDRPDLNDYQLSHLNGSFFKGNAEEGLFIRVGLFRDRLEIFDNRDKSFIIIDGPDLALPAFELIGNELYLGSNPHFRYRDAVVTKNYIFALYGGVSQSDFNKTAVIATQIWGFDHKGKPLRNLKLDRSLINFVINEDTNEIYGLTTDEDPGIAVYTIPKEML